MKLLVFEFITGGGFNQQALPASLLAEGALMLKALLADCSQLPTLQVQLMLDRRCQALVEGHALNTTFIDADEDVQQVFKTLLQTVDAVWLVAPEFDGILETWTALVEVSGKQLLTSSATAVALTADKLRAFHCLQALEIPTPETTLLAEYESYQLGAWVIKPLDGVGCTDTWHISNAEDFQPVLHLIASPQNFIIQPYKAGRAMSLSCLFHAGQGWVLCVNEQVLDEQAGRLSLLACQVNVMPIMPVHEKLVNQIAEAIPGLQGYVGIDLIQSPQFSEEYWVIEINPRLTSSYVGIEQALGLNVVELVLKLLQLTPVIKPLRNRTVTVNLV